MYKHMVQFEKSSRFRSLWFERQKNDEKVRILDTEFTILH